MKNYYNDETNVNERINDEAYIKDQYYDDLYESFINAVEKDFDIFKDLIDSLYNLTSLTEVVENIDDIELYDSDSDTKINLGSALKKISDIVNKTF